MRRVHLLLLILSGLILAPGFVLSQGFGPPGGGPGGPGGGRGMPDPGAMFDRFSGGKDYIDRNELAPQMQSFFDRMTRDMNITGTRITKTQFVEGVQQRMAMRMNGGGSPPPAQATPGDGPAATPAVGGRDQATLDREAEGYFHRADVNNDGHLSFEEMSDTLKAERDTWDKNKDGFIDLIEYKAYYSAKFGQAAPVDPSAPAPATATVTPDAPKLPTVLRIGKLPKDFPAWFSELDTDQDGQVGLYEWRKGGRKIEEFADYDLDDDGFITPEEIIRKNKLVAEKTKKPGDDSLAQSSPIAGRGNGGNSGQGRGFGPPTGGDQAATGGRGFGPPTGGNSGNRGYSPPGGGNQGGNGGGRGNWGRPNDSATTPTAPTTPIADSNSPGGRGNRGSGPGGGPGSGRGQGGPGGGRGQGSNTTPGGR